MDLEFSIMNKHYIFLQNMLHVLRATLFHQYDRQPIEHGRSRDSLKESNVLDKRAAQLESHQNRDILTLNNPTTTGE
jgi:hypothetical protein